MGGRALSIPGYRADAGEYVTWVMQVLNALRTQYDTHDNLVRWTVVPAFAEKDTFGDCDIVVKMPFKLWQALCESGGSWLGMTEAVRNGNVLSCGLPVHGDQLFQFDFIYTGETDEKFAWALRYFSFNDLGNLMGRIANRKGFSYGHDGLWYPLYNPDNPSEKITDVLYTNTDPVDAFRFMGYSLEAFQKGFGTREDIYRYAASSPVYHPAIFFLENRNAPSRVRDAKRTTYMGFLDWIEAGNAQHGFELPTHEDRMAFRAVALQEAFKRQPDFKVRYNAAMEDFRRRKAITNSVPGLVVKEITGLDGKALGNFIHYLRGRVASGVTFADFHSFCHSEYAQWTKHHSPQ